VSGPTPQKAWNSSPGGSSTGRQTNMGREPKQNTRCTLEVIGGPCNRFPSWEVPGTKGKERRCDAHRGQ
jgi:hypothetical protein